MYKGKSIEKNNQENDIKSIKRQTDDKKSNNDTIININEETKNTIADLTNTSTVNIRPRKDNLKTTTASNSLDENNEDPQTVQPLTTDTKKDKTKNQKKPIDNKSPKLGNRINPDGSETPLENDLHKPSGLSNNFNLPNVNPAGAFQNGYNYPRPSGQNYAITGGNVGPGFASSFASASASAGSGTGGRIVTPFSTPNADKTPINIGNRGSFPEDDKASIQTGSNDPLGKNGKIFCL